MPVDCYIGGSEHATMHLLYARFMTKALRDLGHLDFSEPFTKLFHQGIITKDGAKMSKSRGNTVSPDTFIEQYGSDTFRCYLMFMGPYEDGGDWNDKGITGIYRFLNRFCHVCEIEDGGDEASATKLLHRTIKSVSQDLECMKFNTAISRMMECVNELYSSNTLSKDIKSRLITILSPFAPHISEELWEGLGNTDSVFDEKWPEYDESLIAEDTVTIAIQINGKLRGTIEASAGAPESDVVSEVMAVDNIKSHTDGREILKTIYVPNKLVSIVVK